MRVGDRGLRRLVGFRADMKQPRPCNLPLADVGRGLGHALCAEIGGVRQDGGEDRGRVAHRVHRSKMREFAGEIRPAIHLGQKIGDVDVWQIAVQFPFQGFGLIWHFIPQGRND